ncbi:MAG: HD domain-containing phosphohydrolase [Candidatus Omnitrophota bacterium]
MNDNIGDCFKDFLTCLQMAKLYGASHPIVLKSAEKAYLSLQDVLADRPELVIGIIGEELAFEKEIFFDLSKFLNQMVVYLKGRGIERIAFSRGLGLGELNKFIEFLALSKEEIKGDPQESLALSGVRNISVGKVKGSPQEDAGKKKEHPDLLNNYQVSLDQISPALTKIMNNETVDGLSLRLAINNIVNNLGVYYGQLFKLATLKRYDTGTFIHLLNVSILSMHFSSKLGFNKDVIMEIGISALFHDIGKLYISRKTIRKPGQLSVQEFEQMESHTILGAKLLMEYTEAIGIMPVVVSFEHHQKYDLSGYPKSVFKKKQHIVSAIVSICDVYDALSQRRSYKTDYPPDMIYGLMMRGSKTSFDPDLLSAFFKAIGVWPVGSIILLNDKRVGVVVQENETNIFLPRVKIIHPQNNGEIIDLNENMDNIKIERYLSPWSEGKEFLHLV